MTISPVPWQLLVGPAVGAFLAVLPTYLLVVRQTMSAKDALIDALREQNKSLERERLPLVVKEKQALADDIAVRAKEKAESDKVIEELSTTIRKITADVKARAQSVEHISLATGESDRKVQQFTGLVRSRRITDESVGLLVGARMLHESYVEWRLLAAKSPNPPGMSEYDANLLVKCKGIMGILNRVRAGGELVKMEEITPDPHLAERAAEVASAAGREPHRRLTAGESDCSPGLTPGSK